MDDLHARLDSILQGSDEDPTALTGERAEKLRALQADEIKLALADLGCEEKFVNAIEQEVEREVFGRPVGQ